MISITYIVTTQIASAHISVRVTLKPDVYIITSNLQGAFVALADVPALWL